MWVLRILKSRFVSCSLLFTTLFRFCQAELYPPEVRTNLVEHENRWDIGANLSTIAPKLELSLNFVDNEATVEIPPNIFTVTFICNSSYPVSWYVESSQVDATSFHGIFRKTHRVARDFLDPTSFKYFATLNLHLVGNLMTGRYVCHNTRTRSLATSLYIFWNANPKVLLVSSKRNFTLSKSDLADPTKVVFPCLAASPTANVVLYKFTPKGRFVMPSDSISYDPKVGFTLSNIPNISGYYRCYTTTTDWDHDYVGIIVPSFSDPVITKVVNNSSIPIIANGTANTTAPPPTTVPPTTAPVKILPVPSNPKITLKNDVVTCCSGATKAPKIFNILCDHPNSCEFLSRVWNEKLWLHGAFQNRQTRKKDCTSFKIVPHFYSGVIRCSGSDFTINMNYIVPIKHLLKYYIDLQRKKSKTSYDIWTSWSEIVPEEMMVLLRYPLERKNLFTDIGQYRNKSQVIYDGQRISLMCATSSYYFSTGIKWALKYKNQTVKYVNRSTYFDEADPMFIHTSDGHRDFLGVKVNKELEAVICMGPVWNSSLWVNTMFYPYVNESQRAIVTPLSETNVAWYLNETTKSFTCNATGFPLPTLTWLKNEQILENGSNIDIVENSLNNETLIQSILKIHRVSHNTAGIYRCEANNTAGVVFQIVNVQVLEQSNWIHTTAIVIGVISALGLLTGIGVLAFKIRKEKWSVRDLSSGIITGFENGERVDDDIMNQTYDPTSMNTDILA